MLIEPDFKELKLPAERFAAEGYEDNARAFILQAQDEPLDNRDTAVLTNGAETGRDAFEIAPAFERVTPELLALVADEVFGGWLLRCRWRVQRRTEQMRMSERF